MSTQTQDKSATNGEVLDSGERYELLMSLWKETPRELVAQLPRGKGEKAKRQKGHCNECGGYHDLPAFHLDYLGHADACRIIAEVDPEWQWAPDPKFAALWGEPGPVVREGDGYPVRLYISLTILGISRPGIGTVDLEKSDPEKELIGDAIRNAAMRFGVGADLWSKAKGASLDDGQDSTYRAGARQPEAPPDPEAWFKQHGWKDRAEHTQWYVTANAVLSALDEPGRAAFNAWLKERRIAWEQALTRAEATSVDDWLEKRAEQKGDDFGAPVTECAESGCMLAAESIDEEGRSWCGSHLPF